MTGAGENDVSGGAPPALVRAFHDVGLTANEAKVLVALVRLGQANTVQLARVTGVTRTNIYQVLDALAARDLAERVPGAVPAIWTTPRGDELLARLDAQEEAAVAARVAAFRQRRSWLAKVLAEAAPENTGGGLPYVHLIQGSAPVKRAFDRLLSETNRELLMFTRPPYTAEARKVNPAVLDMLARGVRARVLYEALPWDHPDAELFAAIHRAYHAAGVEARVVERLPIKLVVADHKAAMLAMVDPVLGEDGFPTTLLIEHPDFAATQAEAFERLWERGTPVATEAEGDTAGDGAADAEHQAGAAAHVRARDAHGVDLA